MGRSDGPGRGRTARGTGRVIAGGWDGAEDEDAPHSSLRGAAAPVSRAGPPSAGSSRAGSPSADVPVDGSPSAPSLADGAPAPAPRRRRTWLLGGIAALLALVLVLPQVLVGERSPETVARSFLQAILDADTDTTREHLAPPEPGVLDVALTDEVMLATTQRVDRFTLEETAVDGDSAQVTAALRLGSRTERTTLHLTRHREGMLRRAVWELEPVVLPVMRVAVPVSAPAVLINGVEVPLPDEAMAGQAFGVAEVHLVVLPGVYQLSAPEAGEAVTPTSVRSTIPPVLGPWLNSLIEVDYDLTETDRAEVSAFLIDTALADCARSTEPRPESCPFGAPDAVTEQGTWTILTPPEIEVSRGMSGFYDVYAYEGVAQFAVSGADGGTAVHIDRIEDHGIAMRSRDGDFYGTWFGNQDTITF